MKRSIGIAFSSFVAFSGLAVQPAFAQDSGFYGGLDVAQLTISGLGLGDITSNMTGANVGYSFNEFLALELEYSKANTMAQLGFVDVLQLNSLSGFVVGTYPISDRVSLQARAGAQNLKYKVRNSAIAAPIDTARRINDTELALGVGAKWRLSDHLELHGGYTVSGENPFESSVGSSKQVSIGLQWRFGGS
jgi:Outer membrane protein beta-barrel domain